MPGQTKLVYAGLALAWCLLLSWQLVEHSRVVDTAQTQLVNRARDISTTLGLVMRSQRRFGGVISKERIESALNSLVKPGELSGIALLNDAGEVVASSVDFEPTSRAPSSEPYWSERTVTLVNLVELGTNVTAEAEQRNTMIVLPRTNMFNPSGTNRPPPGPPPWAPLPGDQNSAAGLDHDRPTNAITATPSTNGPDGGRRTDRPRWREDGRPPRPFWMSETEYKSLLQKKGVHSFAVVLSTASMTEARAKDVWLRVIISALGSISVVGLGLAWRNLVKSSELEVRLVRAAELNSRLKDMNLAAAGLAHETRNPLNIVRGLAQMISKQDETPPETRAKAREIIDETDRVTSQLNDFINYSRPREVRRAPVPLSSAVAEVTRALSYDIEEKAIVLRVQADMPKIEADEQLLRQALFNLLLNATQHVAPHGEIQIGVERAGTGEASLEIRDDGPGVAPEDRLDIFKPYFTKNVKGTGLGLAVVHQIVLAHGWEIDCRPNEPRGAIFRISHLRALPPT